MYKIFVELQTGGSAFFRMKLRRKDIIASGSAAKRLAVVRFSQCVSRIVRYCIVAVYEIKITLVGNPVPHRMGAELPDLVPAHLRHLEARTVLLNLVLQIKTHDLARHQAQTSGVTLCT